MARPSAVAVPAAAAAAAAGYLMDRQAALQNDGASPHADSRMQERNLTETKSS